VANASRSDHVNRLHDRGAGNDGRRVLDGTFGPNPDNRIVGGGGGGGGGDCNYAELEPIGTMPSLARISYL